MLEAEPCSPVLGYDLINRSIHTFRAGLVIAIAILQCIARGTLSNYERQDGTIRRLYLFITSAFTFK